jgi:glycosyltransferase involved in cell wall biosynthesis
MKILQLLHNFKVGGAEQHLIQLCIALREAGHHVEIGAPQLSWIAKRLVKEGFTVHNFDFKSHIDLISLVRLIFLLKRNRFDLVHTHLVRAALYGRAATSLTKIALVSSVHDLTTWKHYPRTRNIIAVSNAVRKHLERRGFAASKIDVVFPGARDLARTEEARKSIRQQLGLSPEDFAVFLLGRVAEVKGHDIALAAIKKLRSEHGPSIKLFFVGQKTEWGEKIYDGKNADFAVWLGYRDDIPQLICAADLCIQPSRSEGLPLALMEAASASKPLIGTRVGGIPEVIEDGQNGLLISPEDSEALAQAISSLFKNPELAKCFGIKSREIYEKNFSIEKMVEDTLTVYKKILSPHDA